MATLSNDKKCVLLIENDDHLKTLYQKGLVQAGYDVYLAITPKEIENLLNVYTFDLLICDIQVGVERITELLVGSVSYTSLIVISAEEKYREHFERVGADFFLLKPVATNMLVTLADRLTGQALA